MLLALALLVQVGVLVSLSPGERRSWPGAASWGLGTVGAVEGMFYLRARESYFLPWWCGLKISVEVGRSSEQAYHQASDLSQLFQRLLFMPVVVLALSLLVALGVLIATHGTGRARDRRWRRENVMTSAR